MEKYDIYKDISRRTEGDIYIGVVGPVRTGKSTFIKRFMDLMVLPFMEDEANVSRICGTSLPNNKRKKNIFENFVVTDKKIYHLSVLLVQNIEIFAVWPSYGRFISSTFLQNTHHRPLLGHFSPKL